MRYGFPEFVFAGVLVAPFVPQAILALCGFALLRPLLRLVPLDAIFANPPLIGVCLYVVILATIMLVY